MSPSLLVPRQTQPSRFDLLAMMLQRTHFFSHYKGAPLGQVTLSNHVGGTGPVQFMIQFDQALSWEKGYRWSE